MIDVKQAVAGGASFLANTFADEEIRDVRLEEVELSEDERLWHITLSFLRKQGATSDLSKALEAMSPLKQWERDYKVLAIRAEDGRVQSMKIRQLT